MAYHGVKPIESVVYCFYKITTSKRSFHEFTGTINHRFLTNQNARTILGGNYMRPRRTQTGMSSYQSPYISFHAFTCNRPKNELRPVWLSCRSLTQHELLSYRSKFIFSPVPCKRVKRNVWRLIRTHTGLSSFRSHVITPLIWRVSQVSRFKLRESQNNNSFFLE